MAALRRSPQRRRTQRPHLADLPPAEQHTCQLRKHDGASSTGNHDEHDQQHRHAQQHGLKVTLKHALAPAEPASA